MGEDLIGYFMAVPAEREEEVFKEHFDKINNLLNSPNSIKFIKGEDGNILDKLIDLGINVSEQCTGSLEMDDDEDLAELLAVLRGNLTETETFMANAGSYRDVSWQMLKVNGIAVKNYFAGERSWGDEPSGGGYQGLRYMDLFGFIEVFHKAIPWEKK